MVEVNERDSAAAVPPVRFETRDVSIRGVLAFAAGLISLVVVVLFVLGGMFHWLTARETRLKGRLSPLAVRVRGQLPPEPRLEGLQPGVAPRLGREAKEDVLRSYGWVDQDAGIVRIPIENAMNVVADTLPSRPSERDEPGDEPISRKASSSNSGRLPRKGMP